MRSLDPPRSGAADRKPAARPRRPVGAPRPAQAPRQFAGGTGARSEAPVAPAPHVNGGLPEGLRTVMEAMSGFSLADVVVHRNSAEPARLGAAAFARGSQIHVAPGQERHLPHEAWHVVQQKQGRVRPTFTTAKGSKINGDPTLEREADALGARASETRPGLCDHVAIVAASQSDIIQAQVTKDNLAQYQQDIHGREVIIHQYFNSTSERFVAKDNNIWLDEGLLTQLKDHVYNTSTEREEVYNYYVSINQNDQGHAKRIKNLDDLYARICEALREIAAKKKKKDDDERKEMKPYVHPSADEDKDWPTLGKK